MSRPQVALCHFRVMLLLGGEGRTALLASQALGRAAAAAAPRGSLVMERLFLSHFPPLRPRFPCRTTPAVPVGLRAQSPLLEQDSWPAPSQQEPLRLSPLTGEES